MAEIVKFLLPNGTEVSNDPRFYQQDMQRQLDAQAKALLAQREPAGVESNEDDEGDEGDENPYEGLTAKKLLAIAAEREIDTTGLKRKSELVARLEEADKASEDDEDDSDADEDEDDSTEE